MVRTEEVLAQHIKSISTDLDAVFLQVSTKEIRHELAATAASLGIVIVECLGMSILQQVVEPGPVRIGEADEVPHGIHPRRAGEIRVGALLAKVLLPCPGLLASYR